MQVDKKMRGRTSEEKVVENRQQVKDPLFIKQVHGNGHMFLQKSKRGDIIFRAYCADHKERATRTQGNRPERAAKTDNLCLLEKYKCILQALYTS